MLSISQVCRKIGIARSTLLYYERIGIIHSQRNPDNNYRFYTQDDIDSLVLIRQLQKAGFSLKEADAVMKGHLDSDLILSRYYSLEKDTHDSLVALELVKSLVIHSTGKSPPSSGSPNPAGLWHADLEKAAGNAHAKWLKRLGFNEKEQLYIRWVTRNLNSSGQYMAHFFLVFEQMKRQGPGSPSSTKKAFNLIPNPQSIESILEIGCGKGQSSLALAELSDARITAIDNHQPFLDHLQQQTIDQGLSDRIRVQNMSMFDLRFKNAGFDLIWSEGSAYFMGFETALSKWKPLICPNGYLFISDAIWLTSHPSTECAEYFHIEYPGMSNRREREMQACQQGFRIVSSFILNRQDWLDFYDDMELCVRRARKQTGMTKAYEKMIQEVEIGRVSGSEYGNLCLLLSPDS